MIWKPARGGQDDGKGTDLPIQLSRAVLFWESLEIAFWKPVSILLLLLAVALTGFLESLPVWLHTGILISVLALFSFLTVQGIRHFRMPGHDNARRRIEIVNHLDHRPLETLADRPSSDTPMQQALWEMHRKRALARLGRLSVGAPEPHLARRDPWGLRLAAAFFATLALVAAGSSAPDRLASSLFPVYGNGEAALTLGIEAWLAPPDYTGLPPQFISRQRGSDDSAAEREILAEAHATPVGTKLAVQVTGLTENALLRTPDGDIPMVTFAENAVSIEHDIGASGNFTVVADGDVLASWDILATPDAPPTATLPKEPVPSVRRALTLFHAVSDDYGVASLRVEIERADRPAGSAQSTPYGEEEMRIVSSLPVPDPSKYGVQRRVYRDYSAHPWAGGEVRLTLVATDTIGQEGRSEAVTLILPGREFNHPVARQIIELRRELAWDPLRNHQNVADALDALSWQQDSFGGKVTVFMALRQATRSLWPARRSGAAPTMDKISSVIELLWKTALYLEDGGVSLALDRLRAAEQALMDALADGADTAELDRLMDELQAAMQDYMQAMTEQLREQIGEGMELPEFGPDQNTISTRDLDEMMQQLRDMMQSGMTDSAQQMLEQLRRMMENMQAGIQQQMSPDNRKATEMMKSMRDIMESQRELMDRTHRRAEEGQQADDRQPGQPQQNRPGQQGQQGQQGEQRQGQQPGQQGNQGGADALLQDALRRQLGEIMRQYGEMMGEIPEPFGRADEGMGEATESLGRNQPGEAVGPQGQALDALQEAANEARNAFLERFEQQMGMGQEMPGRSGQQSMDPFGRQANDSVRGPLQGEVEVPDKGGLERAREIRDELRRRAGDRSRPPAELDYIDRLLDQFK